MHSHEVGVDTGFVELQCPDRCTDGGDHVLRGDGVELLAGGVKTDDGVVRPFVTVDVVHAPGLRTYWAAIIREGFVMYRLAHASVLLVRDF